MSSVPSFLRRVARLDWRRSLQFVVQAASISRAPRWWVLLDMIWCAMRYEVTFENYCEWDFRVLSNRERGTYMTDLLSFRLSRLVNDPAHSDLLDNKVRFAEHFNQELGRSWLDASKASPSEIVAFGQRFDHIMTKDPHGIGGKGIALRAIASDADHNALREELLSSGQTLLEERITQHEDLARLHPASVNSLRMVSFLDSDGDVRVLAAVLKIGNGDVVDNFSNGGMYTMLDERGRALHAAVDEEGRAYERHPITGEIIPGYQVPHYPEVLRFVEQLARRVPKLPYVGWDIAITAEGPIVIEGNHNTGAFQSKPTVSGIRQGLLPRYRSVASF